MYLIALFTFKHVNDQKFMVYYQAFFFYVGIFWIFLSIAGRMQFNAYNK